MPLPLIPIVIGLPSLVATIYGGYKIYKTKETLDLAEQYKRDSLELINNAQHKIGISFNELNTSVTSLDEAKQHLNELCNIISKEIIFNNLQQNNYLNETVFKHSFNNFDFNLFGAAHTGTAWTGMDSIFSGFSQKTSFDNWFSLSEAEVTLNQVRNDYNKIKNVVSIVNKISDAMATRCIDINKYTALINRTEDTLGQLWDLYDNGYDYSVIAAMNILILYNNVLTLNAPLFDPNNDYEKHECNINPKFACFMDILELGLDQIDVLLSGCGIKLSHNSSSSSLPASAFKPPVSPLLFQAVPMFASVKH